MRTILTVMLIGTTVVACGATVPVPTQRMADAESAERSARELGANGQPQAQLHLKLATDQIAQARASIADGDNERAALQLVRAKADAELAVALARELAAKTASQQANIAKEAAPK